MPKGYFKNGTPIRLGKHHTEKARKKLSEIHKGKPAWNKGKKGVMPIPWNRGIKGIHLSPKSEFKKGQKLSEETKRKISEMAKKKGFGRWLKGRKLSDERKKRMSETGRGKKHTEETKRKISESRKGIMIGEKSPNWRGGISHEPYSVDWTQTLRRSIRERDHYACQICGKEPAIHIHHIDYNKKNCSSDNLITLCRGCHAKTNFNRNYWTMFFINL